MLRRSCSVRAQVSRVCFRSLACSLGSSCATLLDQCLRVLTPAQPAQRVAAPRVPIRRSSTAFHVLDGHVETNTPDFKVRSSSPPPWRAPSAHLADQLERDEQTHEPPQRNHRTDSEGCVHCDSMRHQLPKIPFRWRRQGHGEAHCSPEAPSAPAHRSPHRPWVRFALFRSP